MPHFKDLDDPKAVLKAIGEYDRLGQAAFLTRYEARRLGSGTHKRITAPADAGEPNAFIQARPRCSSLAAFDTESDNFEKPIMVPVIQAA